MKQAMAASRQSGLSKAAQKKADRQRQEEMSRKQARDEQLGAQQQFVRIGQHEEAQRRMGAKQSAMASGLEQKSNAEAALRENLSNSQQQRVSQQRSDQEQRAKQKRDREAALDAEAQRQRDEQLKRKEQKQFISRINLLLNERSCGVTFEDLPNEFFMKFNAEWNAQRLFGTTDLGQILRLVPDVEVLRGGMTKRAMDSKHYNKIRIISKDTNDILTVLAISEDIEAAMRQLRQMMNQREAAIQEQMEQDRRREQERKQRADEERRRREQEERRKKEEAWKAQQTPSGFAPARVDYSRGNNWGLPAGFRVSKTPQGRLFFVNDTTRQTQWNDPRPLPPGWRSGKTPQGRPFYIDDSTKKTSWNDPRPRIQI